MHRVVITGIGVVSPAGMTLDEYWPALVNAHCAIGFIKNIPTERLNTRLAEQVLNFETRTSFTDKQAGQVDRFAQFAVVSAQAAVKDSNIQISEEGALTTAVVVGNSAGGQNTFDDAYLKLYGHNSPRLHPLTIPRGMSNAAASQVSIRLGLKGPAWTVSTACASGTHAIGQAFHMIRSGRASVAVAGGADARRGEAQRPHDSRGRRDDEDGAGVHLRSRHRRTGVADRGKACAAVGHARREDLGDAAFPDQAAGLYASGGHGKRVDRLHARAQDAGARAVEGL